MNCMLHNGILIEDYIKNINSLLIWKILKIMQGVINNNLLKGFNFNKFNCFQWMNLILVKFDLGKTILKKIF